MSEIFLNGRKQLTNNQTISRVFFVENRSVTIYNALTLTLQIHTGGPFSSKNRTSYVVISFKHFIPFSHKLSRNLVRGICIFLQ